MPITPPLKGAAAEGSDGGCFIKKATQINISPDYAGQRIDNFLMRHIKNIPKTHVYKIIRKGEVRVNKGRVKSDYRLQEGDIVRIPPLHEQQNTELKKPASQSLNKLAKNILKNSILYEDEQLIIINKPAGLAVHGGSGLSYGLIELLRMHYPKHVQLDLVHRLDRDTSGCIIVAKKHSMLRAIHSLLREGKVTKKYHALVQNGIKKATKVDVPLLKYTLNSGERMVKVVHDDSGQEALTKFKPLSNYRDHNAMLLEANLITGRTHQIRVHAKSINCPIAGDEKYGDKDYNKRMKKIGLKRLFLHANSIEFKHPKAGKVISVSAPYDANLDSVIEKLYNVIL